MSDGRIERHFAPELDQLGPVRGIAREVGPALGERDAFSAELILSELFTNAIRHGVASDERPVRVLLHRDDGTLRIEVHDGGDGFTYQPRTPDQSPRSGWGLDFVAKLGRDWGIDAGDGTLVWVELALDDAATLAAAPGA